RFHAVQDHIGENRADDAALWRTRLRRKQASVFNKSSLQPLCQTACIHRDVCCHPFVTDVIEAAFDVCVEHPLWRMLSIQGITNLNDGVRSGATGPKAVGVKVGSGFGDWLQSEQAECLRGPVSHRRNPQRPFTAVWLRYVNTP